MEHAAGTGAASAPEEALAPDQVDLFHHNGYLRIAAALPPALVEAVCAHTDAELARGAGEILWVDAERTVPMRLSFLSERGGAYLDLIRHRAVLDPLAALIGPDIEFCHNRHNHLLFKRPGDRGSQFHRDQRGWSRPVVTVIAALDDASVDNGCLWVVPGSHRHGAYARMYTGYTPPPEGPGRGPAAPGGGRWPAGLDGRLIEQAVPVPLGAGDLLFMHCCVLHGAPPNASSRPRRSVTLAYHGCDELQPAEAAFTLLVRGERREAKPGYRYRPRA